MDIPNLRQAEPPKRYLLGNANNQLTTTLTKLEKTLKTTRTGRQAMPTIENIINPQEVKHGLQPYQIQRRT